MADACVTTGVGLRWAFTGPFMTNVLGGGGGKEGFQHLLTHLAPAVVDWTADMDSHKFSFTDENIQKLNKSVQEMMANSDINALEQERDQVLIDTITRKKDTMVLK